MADDLARLPDASFAGVLFPVSQVTTDGGNDCAEHTAYLRPGADIEPTGRKPYRFKFTIPLINAPSLVASYGEMFPARRNELVRAFADTPINTLAHPSFGHVDVFAAEWSEDVSADTRNGVTMHVTFVEHNADVGALVDNSGAPPTNTSVSVQRLGDLADLAVLALNAAQTTVTAVTSAIGSVLTTELAIIEGTSQAFTRLETSLSRMLASCDDVLVQRGMQTAAAHDAVVAVEAVRTAAFGLRDQYLPDPDAVSEYVVPETMAAWEVALAVYGDASLASLVLSANSITDPLAIPAGRRLVILPARSAR